MKTALFLVDPTLEPHKNFKRISEIFARFQDKGLFEKTSVVSLIHSDLYAIPRRWYDERKPEFLAEAKAHLQKVCASRFKHQGIEVLASDSPVNEDLVETVCKHGEGKKADALILSSSDRTMAHWLLGRFTQTAALVSTLPVFIIKPQGAGLDYSKDMRFVVAVDATAPLSREALGWIAQAAKAAKAQVDLVYARPEARPGMDALQWRKGKAEATEILKTMQSKLKSEGVRSSIKVLADSDSTAEAIVDYADDRKAWLTISVAAPRSSARRLLMGSTASQILTLTKRPYLSLRLPG